MKLPVRSSLLLRAASVGTVLLLASGCATTGVTVPTEVKVQVPVPCVSERPKAPQTAADADLLVMHDKTRTLLTWRDRKRMQGYIAELEAVVEGCGRLPAAKPP